MANSIEDYLTTKKDKLERSCSPTARFALLAVKLLMASKGYHKGDRARLRALAQDLKRDNLRAIALATKYDDLFHPNVVRSRRAENRIYDEVIELADKEIRSEAA